MLRLLLKIAVSAALFAIVLRQVDIGAASRAITSADVIFLTVPLLISFAKVVTDAALWQRVLGSLGHRISLRTAILYSIVGSFFGSFGPSAAGVDIFRAAQMRRLGIPTETAIRAVLSSRLVTFVSLLAVITCGLPIALSYPLGFHDKLFLLFPVATGLGLITAIIVLSPVRSRLQFLQQSPIVGKVVGVSDDLKLALTSKSHAAASLLFATSTHLLRVLTFAAIAVGLHTSVSFAALYAFIPLSLLVAMIPITFGSWGLREASVVYFLGWAGVLPAMALSISVTFGFLQIVVAAIGGIVWVFARSHHYRLTVADSSDERARASTEHSTSVATGWR